MVQLVFVHGVATRDTADYRAVVANRDKLFRELLFVGRNVTITSPMWGQFVPPFNCDVLKTNEGVGTYSLNISGSSGLGGGVRGSAADGTGSNVSIGAIGKQDAVAALDAICSELADRAEREKRELKPEELNAFRKAAELIITNNAESVFAGEASAATITGHLREGDPASFGIGSAIGNAVTAVTDRVRNAASTLGFGAVRGSLGSAVGLFLGDVFVYLKDGEPRRKIQKEIGGALIQAHIAARAAKAPLVLVGHSMGGVILVDMLTDLASAQIPEELSVDALITVGSQPGFFAALDLLCRNVPTGAGRRRPNCVKNWLNVFDPIDPLAFRTDMIFRDVIDLSFNSVTGITAAHSTYFQRPQFYARSRKRLQEFGVL